MWYLYILLQTFVYNENLPTTIKIITDIITANITVVLVAITFAANRVTLY